MSDAPRTAADFDNSNPHSLCREIATLFSQQSMITKSNIPPPSDGTLLFPTLQYAEHAVQARHATFDDEEEFDAVAYKRFGATQQQRHTLIVPGPTLADLDIIRSNPRAAVVPPREYDWFGALRAGVERRGVKRRSAAVEYVLREDGVLDDEALDVIGELRREGKDLATKVAVCPVLPELRDWHGWVERRRVGRFELPPMCAC